MARKRGQDAETAIMQDMTTAEYRGATTGMLKIMFEEIFNAIGESLCEVAGSNDEQDGEDEEQDE